MTTLSLSLFLLLYQLSTLIIDYESYCFDNLDNDVEGKLKIDLKLLMFL